MGGEWDRELTTHGCLKADNANSRLEVSPGLSFLTLTLPFDQRFYGVRNREKVYCQR